MTNQLLKTIQKKEDNPEDQLKNKEDHKNVEGSKKCKNQGRNLKCMYEFL